MVSKFKMFSTPRSGSTTIDESDGDTAVKRRCFAPEAQKAGGASLRGQTDDYADALTFAHPSEILPFATKPAEAKKHLDAREQTAPKCAHDSITPVGEGNGVLTS